MARSTRPSNVNPKSKSKPGSYPQKKNSNAAGYAKRKSLKSKTLSSGGSSSLGDVYEYQGERVRRGKLKLQLEKDEILGAGRPVDDEDDDMGEGGSGRGGMHPRLLNEREGEEEEGLGEDEDEEIDSDEAFEESDEERFAGFSFASAGSKASKSKQKKTRAARDAKTVRFAEVDLNEDSDEDEASEGSEGSDVGEEEEGEDEEEEGDPDEFIDVLDILDGRGEPQSDDEVQPQGDRQSQSQMRTEEDDDGGEDEESEAEEDEDEDEDEDEASRERALSPSDDETNDDPNALSHLESFITNLDAGQKRKAPDDTEDGVGGAERARRKRRLLREETQGGVEGEFAAQPGTAKLNLEDLLAPLTTTTTSSALQSLKKSVKLLAPTTGGKTLAAPLPQRTQERLDREAAYEQTKGEIDKWSATMRRIKEAEHLSFPLQAEVKGKVSSLELAAKFKPTTPLESGIDKLLKSAQMRDEDLAHTESLKMNHLSIEDVAQRRAELAKMRELMFRAEVKAKRVKKIKSKTFRRIRKKQRARAGEGSDDDEEDGEEGEEGVLKREVERARERATLRHKNTGKWARVMKERGELDVDQRREINEMLERGEKLRRRIQGRRSDDDSDGDQDEEEDGEADEETIRAGAFDELRKLDEGRGDGEDGEGERKKGKSVFEMKFMKDAMAREQRKADQMVDDFVRELGGGEHADEDDEDHDADSPSELPESLSHRVGGRVSFRPGNIAGQLRTVTSLASDTSSVTLKSTDLLPDGTSPSPATTSPIVSRAVPLPEETSNPWLAATSTTTASTTTTQKKHEVAVGKDSADAEKSKNKLKKRGKKREEEKAKAKEDAVVDVEMASIMTLGTAAPAATGSSSSTSAGPSTSSSGSSKTSKKKGKKVVVAADDEDEESDGNSEVDAQEAALLSKAKGKAGRKDVQAFQQRDLVARAFAGDNVVREFADEKRREIDADAPKEIDTTLAGWGSWGGAGTRKAPPKPYLIKKVAGVDPKSRADYGKRHVIISEKRDKKAAKYQVKDLPYPYTSKAQFERSMDTPLGTEWNTRVGFQRGTLPKVVKKMGTVITPLEKLF